jgi:hypothetical protein
MSGKAKDKKTFGKKIKDISNDTSTLYSLNKNIISSAEKSAVSGSINNTEVRGQFTTLATADLNMRTYDIIDLDRLRFATSKGAGDVLTATDYGVEALYSGNPETAYGIQIRVPSAKSIYLRSGATALATFDDQNGFVTGMGIIGGSLSTSGVVDFDNMVSPSNPATDHVKLFADSDNSNHLTVRKSDGSEVDLETSSSSWVGTATSNLNMATYDITSICRLEFDLTGTDTLANGTTGIDATSSKMHFNVPTGDTYNFTQNNDDRFFIGTSQISWKKGDGTPLRIINDLIPDTDNDYDLGSSTKEWKDLYLDGIAYIDTVSAGTISVTTFSTTGTSNLGDGDTDQVNFYGKTDWKTNTTSSSATTGNREGYITIKINGTDKKLYYYS